MKESFYFPHDYNARADVKITKLIRLHGWAAYGLYWALIEMLYENGGKIVNDYEHLAYDLRADLKLIQSIVEQSDLFYRSGSASFGSRSVDRRLQERRDRQKKAAEAGKLGGEARAKRMLGERLANDELEKEVKEIEQRKVDRELTDKQQLTALIASAEFSVDDLELHKMPECFKGDGGKRIMDLEPSRCQWYLDRIQTDKKTTAALRHRIAVKQAEVSR